MTKKDRKLRMSSILINTEWCKGCGICVTFCPKQVLELNQRDKAAAARPDDCIACLMCERRCPDLAVEIVVEKQETDE